MVKSMTDSRWLDQCSVHRLIIHDWKDHCEQSVSKWLSYNKLEFLSPILHTSLEKNSLPLAVSLLPLAVVPTPAPLPKPIETAFAPTPKAESKQEDGAMPGTGLLETADAMKQPPVGEAFPGGFDLTAPCEPMKPKPLKILWTPEKLWENITATDRDEWQAAYPAVNLDRQLAAATVWLKGNPLRAHKSNWRRFLGNWFRDNQERGGDVASNRKAARIVTPEQQAYRDSLGRTGT
jgi:hypothetical protein